MIHVPLRNFDSGLSPFAGIASVARTHVGEEDDIADALHAGEHHDEAVDADADASGRRHSIFEGGEEIVVELLGFAAALVLEAFALDVGVVQLDRKSTRLNSSHVSESRMPSSA